MMLWLHSESESGLKLSKSRVYAVVVVVSVQGGSLVISSAKHHLDNTTGIWSWRGERGACQMQIRGPQMRHQF